MWWECSECGARVERLVRPLSCRECGTAGVIFTLVDPDEISLEAHDNWQQAWIASGVFWAEDHAMPPAVQG